jgi:tetratricopeptide (TPR) repeat protein
MTRTLFIAALLCFTLLNAKAQGGHQHTHELQEPELTKLGHVNFRTSCSPSAQQRFNQAVAWLHSFEYEEAEKMFTQIAAIDPRCGMAYWGIAMSNFHPLWAPPTTTELQNGSAAAAKAKLVGARTQRERDFINAIDVFYSDADKRDHLSRTSAYTDAMKKLYQENPRDDEAAVFYALSLITTGTMVRDQNYAKEREAAEILKRVLAREPQHPGVAHYLIHGYDYPALAHLALPAARSYASIAPSSAHAQHMPSHIFTRLGLWQEAIRSNIAAQASAKAYAVRHHMPGAWDEQLHAMDYLAYAYLQGAQDKKAEAVLQSLNELQRVDPPNFKVAYAASAIPARYVLERRQWREAARLPLGHPRMSAFPWSKFPWAVAHIHFARAIGAARMGDTTSARKEIDALASDRNSVVQASGDYDWATQVDIKRQIALAWVEYAEGRQDESVQLMRAVADLDDRTEKHPVTPGSLLPAREQLGELLLELKQPAAALQAFEVALRNTPNRFNSLYGAARAARLAGDRKTATIYYRKLAQVCRHADTIRPELEEARQFVRRASAHE